MFSCLHLPGLPAEAALSQRPKDHPFPCAVIADTSQLNDPKAPLLAVNSVASRLGIQAGESSIRARTRCPELRLLPRNPAAEQALHTTLLELAESLSPDFERLRPDTLIADLSGCRPPTNRPPRIPKLRLTLAHTPDLAHLAAMAEPPVPGKIWHLSDFDPLPLDILPLAGVAECESFLPVLRLWGLRTLGELRQLPRQEITNRIGPAAMRLHDILHGRFLRLLRLHRSPESYNRTIHFESPIESLEALLFQASRAFQTLCARLNANHRAAGIIRFNLLFESYDPISRSIVLPKPLNTPAALLRPLHTVFESLSVPSAIAALELELEPVLPLAAQREWLGRQLRHPERWPDTLARLETLLGPGQVGIPVPEDNHRPDTFRLHPASGPAIPLREPHEPSPSPLPLRRFRPPLEVAVASSTGGNRRPLALLTGPHPGAITGLRGPFLLSGDWWNPGGKWRRIEWDVEMENRHLFRLVLLPPDRWLLDGVYA